VLPGLALVPGLFVLRVFFYWCSFGPIRWTHAFGLLCVFLDSILRVLVPLFFCGLVLAFSLLRFFFWWCSAFWFDFVWFVVFSGLQFVGRSRSPIVWTLQSASFTLFSLGHFDLHLQWGVPDPRHRFPLTTRLLVFFHHTDHSRLITARPDSCSISLR
jgi:hypothetical protein